MGNGAPASNGDWRTQVTQLCLTLDALLESDDSSAEVVECYFLEALYCSLGATLMESDRARFDDFVKSLSGLLVVHDEAQKVGPGEIPGKKNGVSSLQYLVLILASRTI